MSEPVNQINHAEVIRDYLEDPMMSAGPSKALASLAAMQKELEEAKNTCAPPRATMDEWIASADSPGLTEEERELRRKGISYLNHCYLKSRVADPQAAPLIFAKNMTACVMIGLDGYAIIPQEDYTAQAERIARLEEALAHIASEEAAYKGGTYCCEYARAALAAARLLLDPPPAP